MDKFFLSPVYFTILYSGYLVLNSFAHFGILLGLQIIKIGFFKGEIGKL